MAVAATSLKLPKTLKDRISRLAKRAGESPHAFMLRLLEERVQAAELHDKFITDGRRADEGMQESGAGYVAAEVHDYLEARVAGRRASRPKPVQWRR